MKWHLESLSTLIRDNRKLMPAVIIIAALSSLLIIRAGYGYHVEAKKKIFLNIERYASIQSMLAREDEVLKLKDSYKERLRVLESGLLKSDKPAIAAAELEEAFKTFASRKGIKVSSEKALPFERAGSYTRIPVEFQINARLSELKELLYDMRSARVLMGARTVRIKTVPEKTSGILDVTLLVEGASGK